MSFWLKLALYKNVHSMRYKKMDYDFKANLTTVLAFIFLPILTGFGVDSVTGYAVVGLLATGLSYLLLVLNEQFTSGFFTVDKEDDGA